MNTSSRFAVAVHALVIMGLHKGDRVSSKELALRVNTNASFIRRVLGSLRSIGLVDSQPGVGGGLKLGREPERITLLEVYDAVEEDEPLFPLPARAPSPECTIGAAIGPAMSSRFQRAELAMKRELAAMTLDDLLAEITEHAPRCEPTNEAQEPDFACVDIAQVVPFAMS